MKKILIDEYEISYTINMVYDEDGNQEYVVDIHEIRTLDDKDHKDNKDIYDKVENYFLDRFCDVLCVNFVDA